MDDNVTYSLNRADLDPTDKTLYVVAKGGWNQSLGNPDVTFVTVQTPIPLVIPDNSYMALVAKYILISTLGLILLIKTLETWFHRMKVLAIVENENQKYSKRLGIDFRVDRERL